MAVQSACSQVVGSCLSSQIFDLAVADNTRVAAGTTPLYLVSRYGGGLPGATQVSPLMNCFLAYLFEENGLPSRCCQCVQAPSVQNYSLMSNMHE